MKLIKKIQFKDRFGTHHQIRWWDPYPKRPRTLKVSKEDIEQAKGEAIQKVQLERARMRTW